MSDRETIARIINPDAYPVESDDSFCWCVHCRYNRETEQQIAMETADKILLAMAPAYQPGEAS